MSTQPASVHLRKDQERRLLLGHLWVFSNEIADDLHGYEPGSLVDVYAHGGSFLGRGYINPHSLITVRLLTHRRDTIDAGFFERRIEAAWRRRQRLFPEADAFRVVFSEGDLLPGLIIDRYGEHLVVQALTLGMELRTEWVCETLEHLLHPRAIVARNDAAIRTLEHLPTEKKMLRGSLEEPIIIREADLDFQVDMWEGQKTGFYLDQRENRCLLRPLFHGARVLDAFCYTGAWALHAVRAGATEVVGVDESARAIEQAVRHAERNGLQDHCRFSVDDVFHYLQEADARQERFDCIILDPPAFVKSRSKLREGLHGYWEINRRAMRLLNPGGFLVTCSCSYHVDPDTFRGILLRAARTTRRTVVLLEMRSQAKDHPVLLPMGESSYLKCAVLALAD